MPPPSKRDICVLRSTPANRIESPVRSQPRRWSSAAAAVHDVVMQSSARRAPMRPLPGVGHPHAIALCTFARGASAFLVGEWPLAEIYCDRALRILRNQSAGTIWELNSAQVFRLGALLYQGKLRECARELPLLLAAARERGNLYFETELRTRMNLVWLAADEPDEGEREANEALRHWSHAGFHRIHYNYMVDRIQTELYRGRARAAWQAIADNWTALERTFLLRVQFQRIEAWYLRARCALLMAATEANPRPFLSIARADAQ